MKIERYIADKAARESRERFATIGRARINLRSSDYTCDMYLTVSTDCLSADGRIIGRASYDGFEAGEATFEKACARAASLDFAEFADEWGYVSAIFGGEPSINRKHLEALVELTFDEANHHWRNFAS